LLNTKFLTFFGDKGTRLPPCEIPTTPLPGNNKATAAAAAAICRFAGSVWRRWKGER